MADAEDHRPARRRSQPRPARLPPHARRRRGDRSGGRGSNGDEAIALTKQLKPAVVVMDCAMPGTSGLVATRKILADDPRVAVLMLSMHSEDTLVRQALDTGARGYILKNALDLDLAAAVRKVAAGETVLDPSVSTAGVAQGRAQSRPDAARARSPAADLLRACRTARSPRSSTSASTRSRSIAPTS